MAVRGIDHHEIDAGLDQPLGAREPLIANRRRGGDTQPPLRVPASGASGWMVTGFTTIPDSNFLTCRTWAACISGSKLRWMTPSPPACAMAIAILASVTVSMAEATIGILSEISRVMQVRISTSDG